MAEKVTAGPITSANGVREAVCINIGNDFVMDDFIMALPLR